MNYTSAIFGTVYIVALAYFVAIPIAYAEPPLPTINTKITNTSANPVPVNGNVVVTGTANVNVTNTVPVSGTVNVGSMPPINVQMANPGTFLVPFNASQPSVTVQLPKAAIVESLFFNCSGSQALVLVWNGWTGYGMGYVGMAFSLEIDQNGTFTLPSGVHVTGASLSGPGPTVSMDPPPGANGPKYNFPIAASQTKLGDLEAPLILYGINLPVQSTLRIQAYAVAFLDNRNTTTGPIPLDANCAGQLVLHYLN